MARETLLDQVPCPPANIHRMPTHFSNPDAAAREYEATLRSHFSTPWPRFDLMFLGLGADGHTASLFPGSAALDERSRWVLPVLDPPAPPMRLTLTFPVLSQSAQTYFLVSGSDKAPALRAVIAGSADPHLYPAAGVHLAKGVLSWWVDRAASGDSGRPEENGKTVQIFDAKPLRDQNHGGTCDGLKVDVQGNIWATGPGGVLVITPAGKHLGSILTNQLTGNCCWGDDGGTLYIAAHRFLIRVKTATKGAG
jgi:hypothetical protein